MFMIKNLSCYQLILILTIPLFSPLIFSIYYLYLTKYFTKIPNQIFSKISESLILYAHFNIY
jgi:hypothetical protein